MNKNILHTVKGVAGCLLMASLAAGCAQEDIDTAPSGGGGMSASSYVSLSFASQQSTPTRSNPTGGEQGDGDETGQDYENKIKSAVAFFYQGSGTDGVNSNGNTPIKAAVSFNVGSTMSGDCKYTTTPQQVDLDDGTYNVLVVANPGADWWTGQSLTLDDVRDHIQTAAWTVSESGYSNFVMTSAADATLTLNSNPESDPAKATVNVERMAARLDYKAEASYTCTDPAYPNATVKITGAALVNNLTAGSYMLKRVADDVNGTNLSYLGNETAEENGAATNYVLDPWTASKNGNLYGTWFMNGSSDPNWWAGYVQPGTSETWQRIGYTLENTTAADAAGSDYSTGVVFKATFHPKGVANYQDGATFFALGTHLFASMEDMMTYVYGADFSQFDDKIDACDNWAAVKTFAASLLDNDPSGYKAFLLGQDEAQDLAQVKESLKWSAYMLSNCGYSASLNETYKVELDQNGIVTRNALQSYGVRTYEDATCYYTWWVRHSNDNNDETKGIMEYAIVRNNIYKLTVNSIYSLGNDVPGEDENIILDVYVNDWLLLEPEPLPM